MSFKEAVLNVLVLNYANFKGRARRSEFWYYTLFTAILSAVFGVLASFGGGFAKFINVVSVIVSLAMLVPDIAVSIRRLHDIGKPWTYILMGLIPIAGPIILLVKFVQDSEPGTNAFGPNPKAK